jgi:deoxycytidylate deaminase
MNYKKFAIKLAKTVKGRYRVAAIVLDKQDRIVSFSTNSYTQTHPKMARYASACGSKHKQFLHAEVSALIKSKGKGYKIFVCRIDSSDNVCMAKPCPICEMAIKEHGGIKVVEYTI